jgi:methylenetetrahydrofolate reductase (NADPH)
VGEPTDGSRPARPGRMADVTDDSGGPRPPEPSRTWSRLHRLLLAGEFVVTAELATSDSPDPSVVRAVAEPLLGLVDAVNCTDNSAAHPHLSPLAAAHVLVDLGIEPIVQFACRDRNRLALQADLLGAAALGARNVLCMTGDDVSAGDHPEAKPLYDIDAIHLLRIARVMRDRGVYLSGRALERPPVYLIGAVENPFAPPLEFRPMRLGKKIEAGAEFVQTQICFNLGKMRLFMARVAELGLLDQFWVIAGVFIPRSARAARYLRDEVPGIDVPDAVIDRLESVPEDRQRDEGIRLAIELVAELRSIQGIAGIHLMTIKNEEAIPRVIEGSGLLPRPAEVGAATP